MCVGALSGAIGLPFNLFLTHSKRDIIGSAGLLMVVFIVYKTNDLLAEEFRSVVGELKDKFKK